MRNYDFNVEWQKILTLAATFGIDAFFVAAIRVAENGKAGREFGVLSESAPTYDAQLRIACISVRNKLEAYGPNQFNYIGRICHTRKFVEYFARIWAPPGATNDPSHLNEFWVNNFWNAYMGFVDDGSPILYQSKRETK